MLRQLIQNIPAATNPNLLVGSDTADDAGVYKLTDQTALVQTVDFFTPIVDDPFTYGQIAAANALSDVYAMGGTPLTALNISAFPKDFPVSALQEILKGGHQKAEEAGTVIVGGHTVQDKELKYGMAVTGLIDPSRIYTNAGAKPNDALILTKPLGTGILTTAIKKRKASAETIKKVCDWMAYLNKSASELLKDFTVHACTDITGFGLAGHGYQMARESGVSLEIHTRDLPHYPEARFFAHKGLVTGAHHTNREYTQKHIMYKNKIDRGLDSIIYDPQTSGGLLISLPENEAYPLLKKLHESGLKESRIVGHVRESQTPGLVIH